MTARTRRTLVSGFEAVVLENNRIRVVVIPSLGGRVWELVDRGRSRQWIWHRSAVPLAPALPGAAYDDVWAGGWEELFPNDARATFEGRVLPDHGEWWTSEWAVEDSSGGAEALLRLAAEGQVRRTACIKEFRLVDDSATLSVSYRIESREEEGFHFLFKQHLPVALTPTCRLALPRGHVIAVDPDFGTILPGPGPFDWPIASSPGAGSVDLSRIPETTAETREFVYVSGLADGWCGVDDVAKNASLRLSFDLRDMPFVWLFLTYGGWRGCYTAVLEPCTNLPKDLGEAVRRSQSGYLPAGGVFETGVAVTLGELVRDEV